ncbi:hypothetical protein WME76_18190 [Sorangium sp. So ce119]|uniref:hypothetical protein n=1 Tax=Sorangium sp. So ce119 TaxID=3133279 RepID=UPI003F5FD493
MAEDYGPLFASRFVELAGAGFVPRQQRAAGYGDAAPGMLRARGYAHAGHVFWVNPQGHWYQRRWKPEPSTRPDESTFRREHPDLAAARDAVDRAAASKERIEDLMDSYERVGANEPRHPLLLTARRAANALDGEIDAAKRALKQRLDDQTERVVPGDRKHILSEIDRLDRIWSQVSKRVLEGD